ncbi:MAG: hypothetical protein BWY05_01464 [Euryarchaeota archaeon ADurb.Bin165]|nr:MAG: hypothetical protein BWY05_01464 [Euryarchaeota archaeon ADurb.Bin165]
MQFSDDIGDICLLSVILQAFVNDVDSIILLPVIIYSIYRDTCLELLKDFPAHHLKPLSRLVVSVCHFLGCDYGSIPFKSGLCDDIVKGCIPGIKKTSDKSDGFHKVVEEFFFRSGGIILPVFSPSPSVSGPGKGCKSFAQILENPAIIDNETVILPFCYPVGPCYSLHEGMGFEWFIKVQG